MRTSINHKQVVIMSKYQVNGYTCFFAYTRWTIGCQQSAGQSSPDKDHAGVLRPPKILPVTEEFNMSDVNDAMENLKSGKVRYRIVLKA